MRRMAGAFLSVIQMAEYCLGRGRRLLKQGRVGVMASLCCLACLANPAVAEAVQELKPRPTSDSYFAQPKNGSPKSGPNSTPEKSAGSVPDASPSSQPEGSLSTTGAGSERKTGEGNSAGSAEGDSGAGKATVTKPESGAAATVGTSAAAGEAFQPGQVVALVGGEPIFVADMLLEINQILDKYMPGAPPEVRQREQGNVVRALVNKYVEQRLMAVDTKRNLPDKVTWEGITQQAEKDFDKKALPLLMEKSGAKTPAEYDANLRVMGSSLRKMRQSWSEEQIIRYFISQKVQTEPTVTRDEMLAEYEAKRAEYHRLARCRWEELMIRFDKCATREEAQAQIVELGNQVVYGASLAAVAEKSSHGFTAHRGGSYEWTTKGSLVNKAVDAAIFELPLNELSEIIESDLGLHIVRVVEREDERYVPFVEVQTEIKEALINKKREANFQEHVAKLRDVIPVEYLVEPLKK
jgi:hypothetical protein